MASAFRDIMDFFDGVGIFDVVLPFLLVFTIVFALLERTKVFGMEKIGDKSYTKKNLNSMAAFVISFFVVGSSELVEIITEISASFVLLLFLVVLFLLLVGSFFQEKQEAVFLEGGWKTVFMIIVFLGLAFIFLDAFGWLEETSDFFSGSSSGELVGSVVLLVIVVLFIVYITQDRKIEKKSS
jgi:hypothetical protein|tara:strand:- start:1506 stop:2054 length:549 start_codon:yes stop_codon:yes gene_type:complete